MAGGLFAVARDTFWALGSYDPEMDVWGGETVHQSIKSQLENLNKPESGKKSMYNPKAMITRLVTRWHADVKRAAGVLHLVTRPVITATQCHTVSNNVTQ